MRCLEHPRLNGTVAIQEKLSSEHLGIVPEAFCVLPDDDVEKYPLDSPRVSETCQTFRLLTRDVRAKHMGSDFADIKP